MSCGWKRASARIPWHCCAVMATTWPSSLPWVGSRPSRYGTAGCTAPRIPAIPTAPRWGTDAVRGRPRTGAGLGRPLRSFVAQFLAQDLADVAARQVFAEFDELGHLVAREQLAAVRDHIRFGQVRVLADHIELDHFARGAVGHADGGGFQDAGVLDGGGLDLVRVHVEARHQDHVLLA